jgi:protein-tyrosine phosphatase
MKYAFVFGLLSVYVFAAAYLLGGWGWLLAWPAVSFLLVTAAYLGLGPRIFGKRSDGRHAWWAVALLLPFLLLTWVVWHLLRLVSREDACNEVAPRLWLGRRPLAAELPPGVDLVVDLTAEFTASAAVVTGRSYLCVPVLDTLAPSEQQLRDVIEHTAGWPGVVYIHCAQGHGRSALVAAALLLRRGLAVDAADAVALLRQARPRVGLQRSQRQLLHRFVETIKPPALASIN